MSMKVPCDIDEVELDGDFADHPIPGVRARCSRCGHETESYGTDDRSVRRCLVLMREECPEGESNYYEASDPDDLG
jgi:hypothetical protein